MCGIVYIDYQVYCLFRFSAAVHVLRRCRRCAVRSYYAQHGRSLDRSEYTGGKNISSRRRIKSSWKPAMSWKCISFRNMNTMFVCKTTIKYINSLLHIMDHGYSNKIRKKITFFIELWIFARGSCISCPCYDHGENRAALKLVRHEPNLFQTHFFSRGSTRTLLFPHPILITLSKPTANSSAQQLQSPNLRSLPVKPPQWQTDAVEWYNLLVIRRLARSLAVQ